MEQKIIFKNENGSITIRKITPETVVPEKIADDVVIPDELEAKLAQHQSDLADVQTEQDRVNDELNTQKDGINIEIAKLQAEIDEIKKAVPDAFDLSAKPLEI